MRENNELLLDVSNKIDKLTEKKCTLKGELNILEDSISYLEDLKAGIEQGAYNVK